STVLIATSAVAGISLYVAIAHLSPFFFISIAVGWLFFLKEVRGVRKYDRPFSFKGLAIPMGIILTAPAIDILFKRFIHMEVPEFATLLGVSVALAFSIAATGWWDKKLLKTGMRMKVWNYSLIILAMFFFVNVFSAGGVPKLLGELPIQDWAFMVSVGFLLGFATGRIQAPMFIIIPIYLAKLGTASMNPWVFAVSYFSVFLGYALAPAHPCVTVSLEYFGGDLRGMFKKMLAPVALCLLIALVFAFFMFP
ncbi:MAG TPA: DUF401 family protein, partial [Euryarchaeota archaeon]|nr:DUF401 family protein [Euryarchaeota archaeon]